MLEAVADNVLSPSGHLTFADLGITPQRIDAGLPLEHVRHYRVGGDPPVASPLGAGCASPTASSSCTKTLLRRLLQLLLPFSGPN